MADQKISELVQINISDLADEDEFVIADASASDNKSITWGEMIQSSPTDDTSGRLMTTGSFAYAKEIQTSASHVDDITELGKYNFSSGDAPDGLPASTGGTIEVFYDRFGFLIQHFYRRDTPGTYVRTRNADGVTWSDWQEFWHTGNTKTRTFQGRSEAEAENVPAHVEKITVMHNGSALEYVRESGGAALTTGDGQDWTPAGNVGTFEHFGARGDGSTVSADMTAETAAIQAAFDWMMAERGRKLIAGEDATYAINGTITGTGPVNVNWSGAEVHVAADVDAFSFSSTGSRYALSSSYNKGATTIAVASTGTALPPGTKIVVVSDGIDPENRDSGSETKQYRTAEIAVVGIGSTPSSVVLTAPLKYVEAVDPNDANLTVGGTDEAIVDAYTTTLNAEIVVLENQGREFEWRGGTFYYSSGNEDTPWAGRVLSVTGYLHAPKVTGMAVLRAYGPAVRLSTTYSAQVEGLTVEQLENDTADGQLGYGVNDGGFGTKVTNCHFHDTRHGYTTNKVRLRTLDNETDIERIIGAAKVEAGRVSHCTATGHATTAAFDTHHGSRDVSFNDCIVYGDAGGIAFSLRGRGHALRRPVVRGCGRGVFAFTEYSSGDTDDDLWTASKQARNLTDVTVIDADFEVDGVPIDMQGAFATVSGTFQGRNTNQQIVSGKGVVKWDASGSCTVTNFGGARVYDAINSSGVFDIDDVNSDLSSGISASALTIGRGVDLEIDVANATGTAISLFNAETASSITNRGRIYAKLPSDGEVLANNGTFSGDGDVLFELDGAADNAVTPNLIGADINVRSVDGTVIWKAQTPGLQDITSERDVVTITGTGSEQNNAWIPKISNMAKHMALMGGGTIFLDVVMLKPGDAATLKFDSFGNYSDQIAVTESDGVIQYFGQILIGDDNSTYKIHHNWEVSENSNTATTTIRKHYRSETETGLATASGNILDFDPTIGDGDTVDIRIVTIRATAGGTY